jgi:hypothetical protein
MRGMMGYLVGHEGEDQDGDRLRQAKLMSSVRGSGRPSCPRGVGFPASWRRPLCFANLLKS